MNRPTFESTVDVLVKAYLNDTLAHGNCYACAVGNIIADALDCVIIAKPYNPRSLEWSNGMPYPAMDGPRVQGWGAAFVTEYNINFEKEQEINKNALKHPIVREQIKATGYAWQELAKIEFAFESAPQGNSNEEWMFNGLMAVIDILADIHNVDLSVKENAKLLFQK